MPLTDIAVICAYLALLPCLTLAFSRRGGAADFLSAHHDLPPWAICLSLVATETSTLTFISVPGVAYGEGMVFVGLACGYLIGRAVVARWMLPLYLRGSMTSAYQYLGNRFGDRVRRVASGAFLATRLAAEGVRLLAGLLPLSWLLAREGVTIGRFWLLGIILAATLAYTVAGGLRAVVWSDVIQLCIYLLGAAACAALLAGKLPEGGWEAAVQAGRLRLFHPLAGHGLTSLRQLPGDPFTIVAALFGGAILAVASHGTDQLMVQRVLAARNLREARIALIGSAFVVALLFGLLSLVGVQLWIANDGAALPALGLRSSDDLFAHFIADGLPPGLRGLLVAGVLSATMGSLSATLNAMAGVLLRDFGDGPGRSVARLLRGLRLPSGALSVARAATLFWAVALLFSALLLDHSDRAAIIVGLTVTGWSYGPTLGAFVYGMIAPGASGRDAAFGLVAGLTGMALFMAVSAGFGWKIAFQWLVPLGMGLTLLAAFASARLVLGIRELRE